MKYHYRAINRHLKNDPGNNLHWIKQMSSSRKNSKGIALASIGMTLSALIWMGAPNVARAADPDIFDGESVSPDPVVKYGLKKVLQNMKIKLPGLPQTGSQSGSSGSGGSSGGSGVPMGSSGSSGGLPTGSAGSGGSLPSLGQGDQSGTGMQDGDGLGLGQGDSQGLGQQKGEGQMPGQGEGQGMGQGKGQNQGQMPGQGQGQGMGNNGSDGGQIAQGEGVGAEMDNPSAIPGAEAGQAGQGPMGDAQSGDGQNANGGNQGMGGIRSGPSITIGDASEMIETAGTQGGQSDVDEGEGDEGGIASKGPPMAGKNKGRAAGVERGESIPSDL